MEMDGRASWSPVDKGWQPANTYVFVDGDTLLIDPGLPAVEQGVMAGLQQLISKDQALKIFLSRAQFDSVGNLGRIIAKYDVQEIFTGGMRNRFDQFEEAMSVESDRVRPIVVERTPEESRLEIYKPSLRILSTYWGYDARSKVVFTSDAFSHGILDDNRRDSIAIDSGADDRITVDDVRAHLHASFWWLPLADKRALTEDLRNFFSSHEVEVIAPARGQVLRGADVVKRHVDLVVEVLEERGQ
ncbi:hypothetical protein [Nocardioides humi]|uniref:hypothetical protein n=1 Tax=Nocardioides humi TaxID=449461 RepID=UPI00112B399B|nr:hypothetical protein [Nocardioides humi]